MRDAELFSSLFGDGLSLIISICFRVPYLCQCKGLLERPRFNLLNKLLLFSINFTLNIGLDWIIRLLDSRSIA